MANYFAIIIHGMRRWTWAPVRVNSVSQGAAETPLWSGMSKERLEVMKERMETSLRDGVDWVVGGCC
jgi:NAD(P)-dependent dehydrogenase (short-subunit alcohol dehydrogenase family)